MSAAISANLPALIIVLPLLAGLLVALVGRGTRAWAMTAATTALQLAMALWLASLVLASPEGYVTYWFGGWEPKTIAGVEGTVAIGIEYRVDGLNALVLVLVSGIGAFVTPMARLTVAREVPEDRLHHFYAVYLLCITGMSGIDSTAPM